MQGQSPRLNLLSDCPECGVSWKGPEIKEEHKHLYGPNDTHYSNLFSMCSYETDRCIGWRCPKCSAVFPPDAIDDGMDRDYRLTNLEKHGSGTG